MKDYYLFFTCSTYHPAGGAYDYAGTYETIEAAKGGYPNGLDDMCNDFGHVALFRNGELTIASHAKRIWKDKIPFVEWLDSAMPHRAR